MTNSLNVVFVRPSTKDDDSTIERHQHLSVIESRSYRGSISSVEAGSRTVSFVAGVGHSIFGSLTLTQVSDTAWSIVHVFVEQEAREIGIGDALVMHAMAFLQDVNATWIGAQAQPGDRALKNLFERHGLVAQTILVGRNLNDPSTEAHASQ